MRFHSVYLINPNTGNLIFQTSIIGIRKTRETVEKTTTNIALHVVLLNNEKELRYESELRLC